MLTTQSLLAWTLLSIGLVIIPGPDAMLIAGHAARRGFRAGMAVVAGIQLGGLYYMALCGFGFLALLNVVPWLFTAVKIAGALYLAWLGCQLVRDAIKPSASGDVQIAANSIPFRQGFFSTILNPKVAIFFLAALPQFVGTGPKAPLNGVLLIAIVYAIGFVWSTVLAAAAAHAGSRVGRSSAMRWFEAALGTALIALAGRLALERN